MAAPSVTNTFVAYTTASASEVNANFSDIIDGLSSGTDWDVYANSLNCASITASSAVVINEAGADVDFRVEASSVPNALFVQGSDGNVGIGTNSPDINSNGSGLFVSVLNSNGSYFELANSTTNVDNQILGGLNFCNSTQSPSRKLVAQIRCRLDGGTVNERGGDISFWTKPNGPGTTILERMTIDYSGNTAINTEFYSRANSYTTIFRDTSADNQTAMIISRSETEDGSEQYILFYEGGTNATSPGSQGGGIRRNSGDTAYEFFNASDIRLKNVTGLYKGGLNVVNNIPVKIWDWKDPKKGKNCVGWIAQDVNKYLPKAVGTFEKNGKQYFNLGTSELLPVMWNAIQEQQEMITALQDEVKALKEKLA